MIVTRWRIQRLWTIETALIDREVTRQQPEMEKAGTVDPAANLAVAFRALADESRSLALLSRYESRLHRMHERTYRTLRQLQQDRQHPPQPEPPAPKPQQDQPPTPASVYREALGSLDRKKYQTNPAHTSPDVPSRPGSAYPPPRKVS